MKKSKVLVLDFDGVILDCKYEKLFSGFNAYYSINKGSELFNKEPLLFSSFTEIITNHSTIVDIYFSLLPFIGIAGENACAFDLIENNYEIPKNHKSFVKYINKIKKNIYLDYHNEIKKLRYNYYTNHFEDYKKITKPFTTIVNSLKNKLFKVNICTAKSINDVKFWIESFGIKKNIQAIISINPSINPKVNILLDIAQSYNVENSDVHFIDDLALNLLPAKKLGFICYLANWGYENIHNKKIVEEEKIKVIDQFDFINLLDQIYA